MDFANLAEEWIDSHEEIVAMEADDIARKAFLAGVEAAQQPRALDKCPTCEGKGYFYIGGIPRIYCDDCNGSGICQ